MKKTNKLISKLLVLLMLLSMAPISAFAALEVASGEFGASGSNLTWSLDIDGVLTVSGNGAMEDFANAASMPWYKQKSNVKTVVIESGVTSIGKDAFYGFSSLVNATISDTVTSIGNRAFSNSALTNFEFSDAGNLKTIGNSAFNSTKIKDMVIPDGVTTLGSYVFGYGPIKSVIIPASVTSVGNYVFEETSSLNEVIFLGNKEPETIGDTVFLACSSLSYVSVPADYEGDTFSNMKVVKATASVAEVNGQGFATLADAINAAQSINGAELKLLSHISIDSGITIESGKFTIDLNGKELFSNGYYVLRVDGADVTIVDSAGGGIFNATNDQGNIVLEVLSGSANISGGTFNSASYPATVKDGTLKLTGKDFVLNGNWRIGWYGGSIDLSACTADEVRIQACADGLQASAVTLPDGWGLFKTDGTPCTDFVKNDIYVAKAGFKVTASVNPAEGGTVEGAGTYSAGETVNLIASASNGYRFVNWIENGEEVSTSAVYTFTASENRELTANFEIVPHTHSFTYSASGDTITAVCANTDGSCPDSEGTLTILAPADLYADGITAKEATIENNLVDTSVAVDITYSTADGSAPTTAGTYTASVTVGGATASVEFTLLNYAAKVTDKDGNAVGNYKTFADAITAAKNSEGSTVTLLDDITLTTRQDIRSGKFTLDLNGKNLINENGRVLYILEEADLTIKDSGEGGTIETKDESVDCIYNSGKLTVESGIIKGDGGIRNFGVLYFNDGTVEADNYPAIANYNDSTVYFYDGVLKGGKNSGAVENGGTLYVYGGEIESIVNANDAYISGGKIDRDDYVALNLLGGTVEITGGNFTGTDNEYGRHSGTPYGEWTVDIYEGASLILSGGEFPNGFVTDETTVNALLAEGYAFYDKDGSKITVADDATKIDGYVQVKEYFAASVTDKDGNELEDSPYKTFADAITAAKNSEGSTLTLLDDVTLTEEQYIRSGKFTLDLNGKTLLNENGGALFIDEEADLTIKDSGEGGTIESKAQGLDTVQNFGNLTVESGIIKGDGGIDNEGILTFKDGSVEAHNYNAIDNSGTAYIYNGTFKSIDLVSITNYSDALVYVYGGEFSGFSGISNFGTAYIEGGKFKGNSYAALNLLGGTVEVTGGSFMGTDDEYGYCSGIPYGEWTVDIDEGATLILEGGEFPNGFVAYKATANALLAEDYYYKDADGKLIDVADDAKIINGYVKVSKGADLSDAVITVDKTEFVYNGQHQAPAVTVTIGGKTLTENVDYVVNARKWENGVPVQWFYYVDAGVYTSVIDGLGDYTGKVEKEFVIKPATVDIIWEGDEFYYTGNPHKVTAKYIDIDGNESNEFELINYVNTDVGVYTATAIFADNNYSATEAAINHTYEIKWYDGAPDAEIGGIKGENGWYTSAVTVTAPEGYTISTAVDGIYGNTITFVENEENAVYYLKQTENGYIAKVELGEIKFDFENPTAEITVGENKWNSFLNTVTFGKFFKQTQSVTIEASDKTSGIAKIEYFIATEEITDFENIEWIEYTEKFNIEPNSKNIIYAKATDKAGRTIIINSDGIVLYTDSTLNAEDKDEVIYVLTKNADQAFNLNLNGNTVAYIKIGESVLDAEDYEVLGNMVLVSAEVLENLEAGEYIITVGFNPMGEVYVDGDAPAEVTLPLTVKKADVTIEISDIGKIYDGKPVTAEYKISKSSDSSPAVSNIKYNETVEFKVKGADDSTYTTEAPVNAGEYTVRITVAQTDKISYAQATADFTIAKKPVTVTATAPDKVYDGTTDILEYSKVIVEFDGAVEGEMLGFTVGKAWYDTSDAGTDKTVHIIYAPVASNNIDNYEFPMNPEYSTDNCYVAAKADITKKAVSVSATVPDRIYGESVNCDTTKVVITFDGIVEGDDVGYVVTNAWYHEHTVTNNAPVPVIYNVNGVDADNYQFPEFGDYLAPDYGVEATGRVLPRDIANAEITLGDALVYNGAEQTQTVAAVTVDGLEVTYTVSGNKATNVGVYELTITGNGNFTGETTALYEIAPDTTGVDVLTVDNVKSSDKEAIEAVAQQIENAVTDLADDEKKAEYKAITDKCDELLSKINDTANEIERIDEAVNGYDKETVTSADVPELGNLIDDIKALTDGDNLTEDEKAALEEADKAIDELVEKLAEVAEEIKKVDEAVKSYNEETVKSTDSEDLAQLKEDIQSLIDSDNTTGNEKTAFEEMIKDIEGLEDKIEETEAQLEKIAGIENVYNPETVTSDDKAAIEEAIAEIEAVNPDNLTDEQREEYEEIKAGLETLLEEIAAAEKDVADISVELEMFDEKRVTKFWEDDIEALKAKIDELLADENMGEAEKAKLNEYKAQCDKLIEIINTPVEYFSLRFFYLIWDCLTWKWDGLNRIFEVLFGFKAAA